MGIYQLAGVRVALLGERDAIYEAAREALSQKSFTPAEGKPDLRIDLAPSAEPLGADARLLTPEGERIRVCRHEHHMQIEHRTAGVVVATTEGVARACRLPPSSRMGDNERLDVFVAVSMALYVMLHHRGYFALHAVGLVGEGRGYLLSGQSDSGKSTTALALVRQGWPYLSDDSLLLQVVEDRRVRAIGLRRDFCVDPDAADRFPELAAHEWPRQQNDPAKWRVDVGRLYGVPAVESCEPRVLLFPEVGHVDTSRFELVSSADAVARLVRQSAYFLYRHDPTAGRHFAALGHLVRQSTVRRLILGRDVLNEPERFSEVLLSLPRSA